METSWTKQRPPCNPRASSGWANLQTWDVSGGSTSSASCKQHAMLKKRWQTRDRKSRKPIVSWLHPRVQNEVQDKNIFVTAGVSNSLVTRTVEGKSCDSYMLLKWLNFRKLTVGFPKLIPLISSLTFQNLSQWTWLFIMQPPAYGKSYFTSLMTSHHPHLYPQKVPLQSASLIPEYDCVPLYVPGTCCPVYTCANSKTSLLDENTTDEEAHRKTSKGGWESGRIFIIVQGDKSSRGNRLCWHQNERRVWCIKSPPVRPYGTNLIFKSTKYVSPSTQWCIILSNDLKFAQMERGKLRGGATKKVRVSCTSWLRNLHHWENP